MAENTSVSFLIETDLKYAGHLYGLREYENLLAGIENDLIVVKDFTAEQFALTAKIPFTNRYELHASLLFLPGKLVPEKKLADTIQWKPLNQLLTVERPALNHNYFGLPTKLKPQLVADETEQPVIALLADEDVFKAFMITAPAVRTVNLKWIRLPGIQKVLISGTPFLPLPGISFWQDGRMLIPAGYVLNYALLGRELEELMELRTTEILLWIDADTPVKLNMTLMEQLTRGSARLTFVK